MNIICKVWGHSEVHDQYHPVSWCHRCDETMSQYDYPNEDLSESWELGRPYWALKGWLAHKINNRVKLYIHRYKEWRYGEDYDIPF